MYWSPVENCRQEVSIRKDTRFVGSHLFCFTIMLSKKNLNISSALAMSIPLLTENP